ncbi:NAD(P)/FAD-dependent oxidoreductase [Saccharophagus degradans]|uniref:phytoene desaturase family protein n=1 Tax=Saccharophagus degradans TaxID=86304 RepID=UPI001C09FC7D|nr:NAD(P)/FAD-dependent oxidoreductase [Saccharophagus degradans]MBU2984960.1 NAD(P)/FAD-dependent oxidoreductase [Saccharophagus degradans]
MSLNVNTSSNSSPKAAAQSGRPTVLIIGAGVAGLSTGSYLQMNGFDTHILERHTLPGGCCTAWTRNGYIFDYCIEWFLGSGSNNDANQVWQELGALDGKSVRDFDLFNRVVDEKGREINFYNDPDRLLQHMNTLAPQDAKTNKAFCDDLRRFTEIDFFPALKPNPLMSWREKLNFFVKVLPAFRLFWRTGATQMETFAQRFNDPLLRKAMPFIFFQDHECFPMLPYLYNMAQAHKGNAGFPQGGSLGVAQSMAERYLELGGKITYGVKATKILLENNKAIGVQSKNKKQFFADKVVAACDGFTTLYHMLDGKYLNPTIDKLYDVMLEKPGIIYPGVVSVFIGYKGEVGKSEPHSTTFLLDEKEAKSIPGCKQNSLVLQHRSRFAEGFAPVGCSVMHLTYLSDFEEWDYLRSNDKPSYRARKEQVGENICRFLERRYPGIRENIEVVEIATPVTQKRYTGNTKGSILAWKSFTEAEDLANKLINKYHMQLPGLDNFFMAGQWIGGGSLLRSALSGRYAAQFLCQAEKRPFNVTQSKKSTPWKELYFSYNNKPAKTTPANQGAPHAASTQTA